MAKIDNQQFTEEKEINIQVLVEDILEKNRESFILKNIDIKVIPSSEILVFANPSLMEILFGNLISNAFRYTPENGSIEIGINKKHITIKNSSSEGKSLEVQKLFHRFQKQNHSHKNSIGVGLEICKRICIQNKFKIQYSFSENWHQFEVLF
jgi:signal transduction histidine kinase